MANKLRVAYFASGPGSGTTYRGLALWKAIKRAGYQVDFAAFITGSDYTWLYPEDEMDVYEGTTSPCMILRAGMRDFRPDVLITSYLYGPCQEILADYPDTRLWMLMRGFKNMEAWFKEGGDSSKWFRPELWEGVAGIEPGVAAEIERITGAQAHDIPPVIATWPEELVTEKARLVELRPEKWHYEYRGPIRLVANNGVDRGERSILEDYLRTHPWKGATIDITQNPMYTRGINRKIAAQFFPLVDELVAKPGYNIWWEWQKYGRGKAVWLPVPKSWDIQEERLSLSIDPDCENGADTLMRMICA